MARINLLPWREELRKQQQQEFGAIAGAALVATLLLIGAAHLIIQGKTDFQIERNNLLKREIAELEKKIKEIDQLEKLKTNLISRMEVIQKLQLSRPQIVHLVDEVIDALPDGAYLTSLKQDISSVVIDGKAQSNARVSSLMRGIEKATWMTKPTLKDIVDKDRNQSGLFTFSMQFQQTSPNEDEVVKTVKPQSRPAQRKKK